MRIRHAIKERRRRADRAARFFVLSLMLCTLLAVGLVVGLRWMTGARDLGPPAADLNPVEAVWSHTKHSDLANYAPDSIQDLEQSFLSSMVRTRGQRHLLSAFFKAAGLKV